MENYKSFRCFGYIYIDDKGIFVIKSWFLNGRARQEKGIISIKGW